MEDLDRERGTNPQPLPAPEPDIDRHIKPDRLKGFLLAPWRPTLPETREKHMDAIGHFGKAIAAIKAG